MQNTTSSQKLVWWVLWLAMTGGVIVLYLFLDRGTHKPTTDFSYLPLPPLFASAVLRWFVLPRFKSQLQRLPIFIAGMAMAEVCGILGIFLGSGQAATFFTLSLIGMAQYFPPFVPPKSEN